MLTLYNHIYNIPKIIRGEGFAGPMDAQSFTFNQSLEAIRQKLLFNVTRRELLYDPALEFPMFLIRSSKHGGV